MDDTSRYVVDKRYVKDDPSRKPDYGWRFQGRTVILHEDKSIAYGGAAAETESAFRGLSADFSSLDQCLQCGVCTNWCPNVLASKGKAPSPRELIQRLRLGLLDLSGEELWNCSHCGGCTTNCPYEVPFIDAITGLRKLVIGEGFGYVPPSLKSVLGSLRDFGNPLMQEPGKRTRWIDEAKPTTSKDADAFLLFAGCSVAFDKRARNIGKAAVRLLQRIGAAFDLLGGDEACCGDGALRAGDEKVFEQLKGQNAAAIKKRGLKRIVALSPHCAQVLRTSYFANEKETYTVEPFVRVLHGALKAGSLTFTKAVNKTVTFHDPCFLAKHNGIEKEPRELLAKIDGLKLVEMAHHGKAGLCCGGGGGGVWLDRKKGERPAEVRLEEALATGAGTVVTACPFCLSMLEDAAKSDPRCEGIKVMDLNELLAEAL